MFCRYCGAHIADDSVFCAKCGKRLGSDMNPRVEKIVRTLRLKTPYPYFILLFVAFIAWAIGPRQTHADYSNLKWSIELDKKLDVPQNKLYHQNFWLVLENTGSSTVSEIPVDVAANIEPQQNAEVMMDFNQRRLVIMHLGKPLPVLLILSDKLKPGAKRRYAMDGSVQAETPFKVTYEIREQDSSTVLASYVVER